MRLYIAGPMTGLPDYNFPAFNQAAVDLRALGYDVANPAKNGADPSKPWDWYMRCALTQMLVCDGVAVLPGWAASRGASLEVHVARRLEIPVRAVHEWPPILRRTA